MACRRGDGVPADASPGLDAIDATYTQITAEFEAVRTASREFAQIRQRSHPRHRDASTQVFLVRAQDMDNIINVEVASEFPGGLGYSYFPAAFVLEIGYKQVTMPRWKYKEIIFAVLHVQEMQSERRNEDGSPVGPPDYEYTLDVGDSASNAVRFFNLNFLRWRRRRRSASSRPPRHQRDAFLASRRVRVVASRDLGTAAVFSAQTRTRRPSHAIDRLERAHECTVSVPHRSATTRWTTSSSLCGSPLRKKCFSLFSLLRVFSLF